MSTNKHLEYQNILKSDQTSLQSKVEIALKIINDNMFDLFEEAFIQLEPFVTEENQDIMILQSMAYAAWVTKRSEKSYSYSMRAIAIEPQNSLIYRTLIMNQLTEEKYTEAFLTISAAQNNCSATHSFESFLPLVKIAMKGVKCVNFTHKDISYSFLISCFDGQAMESSIYHCHGKFTEIEELEYLTHFVKKAETIVEIGILMGNHTIFFLKNLSPKKIVAIDASHISINFTTKNFDLNKKGYNTTLETIHCGVGEKESTIPFAGQEVPIKPLDMIINEPFDFIKVDVDGYEMKFLYGAKKTLLRYKPKVMIEIQKDFNEEFLQFISDIHYKIVHKIVRNVDTNYFLEPDNKFFNL